MPTSSRTSTVLLIGGTAAYVAALAVLIGTGHTAVRYSGDDADTVTLWLLWLPALAGLAVAWAIPPRETARDPFASVDPRRVTRQAGVLAALGVVFTVGLHLAPRTDLWFVGLKLALLVAIPWALRMVTWREWALLGTRGRWLRPLAAVLAFELVRYLTGPESDGVVPDALTIAFVFLFNAVIEEVFYRFWLQTRLESRCGRWPAILVASVLWASWHSALLSMAGVGVDLAVAVAKLGVDGLFLGYLWSRHRNPWVQLLMHGLINAPIVMLLAVG
ncbi:CPBP family intramembrane glutamic endopeptidase [Nocardia sp. CC227C]|uniref:CPBP family intramembrane glutamic endopeptidase n=1 Tax=Nocardia sp. CC227C TaxID=3044562 RepID=UPI00278BD387|nr:CPBP family intramembrane glutamic endopeptidase [Nocardia sp. CC227C]